MLTSGYQLRFDLPLVEVVQLFQMSCRDLSRNPARRATRSPCNTKFANIWPGHG